MSQINNFIDYSDNNIKVITIFKKDNIPRMKPASVFELFNSCRIRIRIADGEKRSVDSWRAISNTETIIIKCGPSTSSLLEKLSHKFRIFVS